MFEVWLGKIVKCAFGVQDDRECELVQHRQYEIYLVPRQDGVYDCFIHKYGKEIKRIEDCPLDKDEIVKAAKEWIDEL